MLRCCYCAEHFLLNLSTRSCLAFFDPVGFKYIKVTFNDKFFETDIFCERLQYSSLVGHDLAYKGTDLLTAKVKFCRSTFLKFLCYEKVSRKWMFLHII